MEFITKCRLCENKDLTQILDLGVQAYCGIFPKSQSVDVPRGPLELYKCDSCHLVQLGTDYDPVDFFTDTYGYRSGLNKWMVNHLKEVVEGLLTKYKPKPNSSVLDIGSSDGTLLGFYPETFKATGVDPLASKFKYVRAKGIEGFFTKHQVGNERFQIITSIAMLYDLKDPVSFASDVRDCLDSHGVWYFEQSYLPSMLSQLSYDTVCHEHLTYYGIPQVKRLCEAVGLKIIDLSFNHSNGGSLGVTAAKKESIYPEIDFSPEFFYLGSLEPFREFEQDVKAHKVKIQQFFEDTKLNYVLGYGASTKGNVILQYCGITPNEMNFIADANSEKWGSFTPGTKIPIISEKEARLLGPEYFFVLPWHFRETIIEREAKFLLNDGKLLFPLPHEPSVVKS